ncbi:MAG: hypothetical protein Q7R81_07550 [Candidatus Peregrinibacteria bacterium]|nr:hypothetical protein [Candidatus Peregrinibacteria bacterium]
METAHISPSKRGIGPGWKFWAIVGVWVAFGGVAVYFADTLAANLLP